MSPVASDSSSEGPASTAVLARSLDDATGIRREFAGEIFEIATYFDGTDGPDAPHAYLVQQAPGSVVPPHFHSLDQFQVVVDGEGTLGRKPATPYLVHYTNAFTGYGPIAAGPQGLTYLTLRGRHDEAARAQRLPDAKSRQAHAPRRHRVAHMSITGTTPALVDEPLFPPEDDGLGATHLALSGHVATELAPAPGEGRYVIVLVGSVLHADTAHPQLSCLFVRHGQPLPLQAGDHGAQLLVLDLPKATQLRASA